MTFRGMKIVRNSVLCLCASTLSANVSAQIFTTIINVPPDPAPSSIESDTQLNLSEGGSLGRLFFAGNQNGSSTQIEVNITGGAVGSNFAAFAGSIINIRGGEISGGFNAGPNSVVNLSGGSVGRVSIAFSSLIASSDSTVNIMGGEVGRQSLALAGSTINLSGGTLGPFFSANLGSTLNISGGEFFLNGEQVTGLDEAGDSINVDLSGVNLTATLADGTVRVFGPLRFDDVRNANVNLISSPLPPIVDIVNIPSDTVPSGLRAGQTLNLTAGGGLPDFFATTGSTINIGGGAAGKHLLIGVGSTLNISGGMVGENLNVSPGSTVNINGGIIAPDLSISGTANITSGMIGRSLDAFSGSTVNLFGGTWNQGFHAHSGSVINLKGRSFELNGYDLTQTLTPGEIITITQRNATLAGVLSDGSPFQLGLSPGFSELGDHVHPNATLTITLVPEPATLCLLATGSLGLMRRRIS